MSRLFAICLTVLGFLLCTAASRAEQDWGTIQGQVVWAPDKLPQPVKVKAPEGLQLPACVKGGEVLVDQYVVDPKTRGVRWVVVWLLDASGDPSREIPIHPDLQAIPAAKVLLDQPCITFEPRVVCLREGQTVVARNSAPFVHNVTLQEADFNHLVQPGKEKELPPLTAAPLPLMVECSFHPWMIAWVGVFKHPYFAVTDEEGKFKIDKAPAGAYRIIAWQETDGFLNRGRKKGEPIEIKPKCVTEVKFELQRK